MSARASAPSPRVHGVEQRGVLTPAALLLFGKELEVVARYDPDGLSQVGEQAGRSGGPVDGPVEAPVGLHDVVGFVDGAGHERPSSASSAGVHARGGHLGPLAGEGGQDGEVVDRVLRRDADDRHAAPGCDLDQPLVGQLQQGLADRGCG